MALGRKSYGVLLGLFLAVGVVWAKEPKTCPESGTQIFLGLDDTSAPTQVADGRATDIQNIKLDVSRAGQMRHGIDTIGDNCDVASAVFPAITGHYYTKFSSGTERILRICGTRVQYLNSTVWTDATNTGTITAGQNNQFVFATALDEIIFTNDTDLPQRYTASDRVYDVQFTGLTNAVTKAKTVAFFKNYLIVFNITEGGTDYPTRFRWSNVGFINSWSDEDRIDIGALSGQEINAVSELYDNLYVFLTDSIYKISLVGGADTWQVSKITEDIGSIAKNSVQSITLANAQSGLVFLDRDKKIYFFNGIYARDISPLIATTMSTVSGPAAQYAVSADTNTDYWLCLLTGSTGSENNLCLDLQYQIGEWTKHTNVQANAMAQVLDSTGTPQVYFGNYRGFTYQLENTNLRGDVATASGQIVQGVGTDYATDTASGLQILYVSGSPYTTDEFAGAPIEVVTGAGSGRSSSTVLTNTTSGIVVTDLFNTISGAGSVFEIGGIDSIYTTKWYDVNYPAKLKEFGELYLWADADAGSTPSIAYATDFNANLSTTNVSLDPSTTNTTWGSTVLGVPLYGTLNDVFRIVKLESQGRFVRFTFSEDDPGEPFKFYGWSLVYWDGSEL